MNGNQYCIYCASCVYLDGKLICDLKDKEMSMNSAQHKNECADFSLSPMGNAITGKQYKPQKWKWIRKYS